MITEGDEDEHGVKLEGRMFVSEVAALNSAFSVRDVYRAKRL